MNERITQALNGLKDFQTKTVDYVYDQLYNQGRNRMLIADEVGLGKTIVAKGIIAKGFKKYLTEGGRTNENPTFNVVYICSNLALAAQNIRKLNFMGGNEYVQKNIDRLTYLAYEPKEEPPLFLINSLTPRTSFEDKSHQGKGDERAILYCLLRNSKSFDNREEGLKWLLKGPKDPGKWEEKINWFWENRHNKASNKSIRKDLYAKYRAALMDTPVTASGLPKLSKHLQRFKGISLWNALLKVCEQINEDNHQDFPFKAEVILNLRRILSRICLEYLNADVFILDEFQRYNNLIKLDAAAESPAIELARTVFQLPNAKVLMLSATPFKPFTNDFDELNGEVHYKEFETVLKFLMQDRSEAFWQEFRQDRKSFFSYLRHPDNLKANPEQALQIKQKLEGIYREGIVRTERLLAAEDRDAMVRSVLKEKPLQVQHQDIEDFVILDQITQRINQEHKAQLPIPMEYVKSSPFALSFLDHYQHKKKLGQFFAKDKVLKKLLDKTKHAWVNLDDIEAYKPVIPPRSNKLPNAKLRLLLDETIENGGWKLLWIPPTLNYYPGEGAYKDMQGFSKSLIFSSWLLVPRMISALVSYEAERKSVGTFLMSNAGPGKDLYSAKPRSPKPLFTFKFEKEQKEPQRMPNFILLYPCLALADLYDPATNLGQEKPQREIKQELVRQIKELLSQPDIQGAVSGEGDYRKWFWAAPILLDRASKHNELIKAWFGKGIPTSGLMVDAEDDNPQSEESSGKGIHFDYAKDLFLHPGDFKLPRLNEAQLDDVAEFLASLTLGSPAICYLRAQLRHFELKAELLNAAFNVGSGFITMYNKPESIAVIRLTTKAKEYIDGVLEYAIHGNIQAMLDEFVYLLFDCENLTDPYEISNHLSDILSVRTSGVDVDDLDSFKQSARSNGKKERKKIRTHYAADFGSQKVTTANTSGRQINIRQAFNSPFRPFVLATTSIGQEGLDFHLYCKKIFHWNLPSNPIDFEQREGRIHRYKGLVIRQNLSDKYAALLGDTNDQANVWKLLFDKGSFEKHSSKAGCELVPFWHTESNSNIKIERFVPLYPFSKDVDRYKQMLKVLTFYRLTFGQPRQEELIDALESGKFDEEFKEKLEQLIINLSPVKFFNQ